MYKPVVKICGITRVEDALAAQEAGADWIGFVFANSPRRVEVETAARIRKAVDVRTVGVFVNDPPDMVQTIADAVGLDYAQLHGNEPQADIDALRVPAIKAIRVASAFDLAKATGYRAYRLLLDTFVAGTPGGTGKAFDWSILETFDHPFILAGGLTMANVGEAIRRVRPWGVDASTSLETTPGIKDAEKVADFIAAAKGAAHAAG